MAVSLSVALVEESSQEPEGRELSDPPGRLSGLERGLLVSFLVLGSAFRLAQYLSNRSLWLDESLISLNICGRGFWGLTQPLDYAQGAPLGFLWLAKSCQRLFGSNEFALRLVSLVAGFATLLLTYPVARRLLGRRAAVFSTMVVAVAPFLVYYSSEVKQYELDAAVALLILLTAVWFSVRPLSRPRLVCLSVLGAVSVWCSHPAVFVLAASGLWLATVTPVQFDPRVRTAAAVAAVTWSTSFLANYVFFLRPLTHHSILNTYWQYAFLRFPPHGAGDVWQYVSVLIGVAETLFTTRAPNDSTGIRIAMLAVALVASAVLSLWNEDRRTLIPILGPFALVLVAATLEKYPARGRLITFCLPGFALLIGKALADLTAMPPAKVRVLGWTATASLLSLPVLYGLNSLVKPPSREEVRPAVEYLAKRFGPEDAVLVYFETEPSILFYRQHAKNQSFLSFREVVLGPPLQFDKISGQLDRLAGQRAWLVLSHLHGEGEGNEGAFLLGLIQGRGRLLEMKRFIGASVYQFELDKPRKEPEPSTTLGLWPGLKGNTPTRTAAPGGKSPDPTGPAHLRAGQSRSEAPCSG